MKRRGRDLGDFCSVIEVSRTLSLSRRDYEVSYEEKQEVSYLDETAMNVAQELKMMSSMIMTFWRSCWATGSTQHRGYQHPGLDFMAGHDVTTRMRTPLPVPSWLPTELSGTPPGVDQRTICAWTIGSGAQKVLMGGDSYLEGPEAPNID